MTYASIVVGTDGSATAERAVARAGTLAALDTARVIVVTAYMPGSAGTAADVDSVPADIRFTLTDRVQAEELAERGRKIAKEAGAPKVVVQAISGEPGQRAPRGGQGLRRRPDRRRLEGADERRPLHHGERGLLGGPPRAL